eukprot:TRINITY_DN7544_c0_g1_i2.p1 TRINITY_DN7544_c0_g1~~TRINITY_DN7544_c0_g1_i2.p1  ORF type:complete len:117 (-),score=8.30 TRINITY_DN7544_c0_g1_i2:182-532(-)
MKELYSEQSNLAGIHDCTNKVKFNTRGLVRDRILHKTARNKAWIFLLGHVVFCCLTEEQKKLLEQYRCWGLVRDRILHKTARNKAWIFLLGHVVFCCLKDAEEQKKMLEQYRCLGC